MSSTGTTQNLVPEVPVLGKGNWVRRFFQWLIFGSQKAEDQAKKAEGQDEEKSLPWKKWVAGLIVIALLGLTLWGLVSKVWETSTWRTTIGQLNPGMVTPEASTLSFGQELYIRQTPITLKVMADRNAANAFTYEGSTRVIVWSVTEDAEGNDWVRIVTETESGWVPVEELRARSSATSFETPAMVYKLAPDGKKIVDLTGIVARGALLLILIVAAGAYDRRKETVDLWMLVFAVVLYTFLPLRMVMDQTLGIIITGAAYFLVIKCCLSGKRDCTSLYAFSAITAGLGMVFGYAGALESVVGFKGALSIQVIIAVGAAVVELGRSGNWLALEMLIVTSLVTGLLGLVFKGLVAALVLQSIGLVLMVLLIGIFAGRWSTNGKAALATKTMEMSIDTGRIIPIIKRHKLIWPVDALGAYACVALMLTLAGVFVG